MSNNRKNMFNLSERLATATTATHLHVVAVHSFLRKIKLIYFIRHTL